MVQINQVIISGNITGDPNLRETTGNSSVVTFSVAHNRTWKNANGDRQSKASFFDVVAFGPTAINVHKFCSKGDPIIVFGELEEETWEKDGIKHKRAKIRANNVQFLNGPKDKAETTAPTEDEATVAVDSKMPF